VLQQDALCCNLHALEHQPQLAHHGLRAACAVADPYHTHTHTRALTHTDMDADTQHTHTHTNARGRTDVLAQRPQLRCIQRDLLSILRVAHGQSQCSPGADVGRGEPNSAYASVWDGPVPARICAGARPVPAQMWAGASPVPVQMWAAAHLLVRPVRRVVDVHVADILPLDLSSGRR
jgi:hypothetical protein